MSCLNRFGALALWRFGALALWRFGALARLGTPLAGVVSNKVEEGMF